MERKISRKVNQSWVVSWNTTEIKSTIKLQQLLKALGINGLNTLGIFSKKELGLIHRQLRHAPSKFHHQIYRTTTLPRLEYCCAVWDPHHQVHKRSLESVQKFAARIITTDWKADYPSLCAKLNMKTLATRRHIQKLKASTTCLAYHLTCSLLTPILHSVCIIPNPFSPHLFQLFTDILFSLM